MRGRPIDIDGLHGFLFRRADRLGRLRLSQRDFAVELGIAHETVCRIIAKMVKQERMRRIKSEKNNVGVYAVMDPAEWVDPREKVLELESS